MMDEKMGFFKRVKTAVVNFEGYQRFADEKSSKAVKYFFQIVLIFVIFASIAVIYPLINNIKNGVEYMKTDIPNFTVQDNKLTMESEEPVTVKNENVSLVISLNPNLNKEDVNKFFEENNTYNNAALFIQDEFFIKIGTTTGTIAYDYKTLSEAIGIQELSKQAVIDYFDNSGYIKLFMAMFLFMLAYLYLTYIIVTILDVLILSILSFITVKLYRVKLDYKQCINISIYALTLPIILNTIYVLINAFTGFTIEYFQIMYNIISYIYIVAAILMIKADYNKTGSDVIKIVEEIKKNNEEEIILEEPKQDKKKDKEKKKEKEKKEIEPEPNPGEA